MKNRRNVLQAMTAKGGFKEAEVRYIRDGLVNEGWRYHQQLPIDWMFKMYNHKIEGLDTNVLYTLSPEGTIYRSKKMLMKKGEAGELGVNTSDLLLLPRQNPTLCLLTHADHCLSLSCHHPRSRSHACLRPSQALRTAVGTARTRSLSSVCPAVAPPSPFPSPGSIQQKTH